MRDLGHLHEVVAGAASRHHSLTPGESLGVSRVSVGVAHTNACALTRITSFSASVDALSW